MITGSRIRDVLPPARLSGLHPISRSRRRWNSRTRAVPAILEVPDRVTNETWTDSIIICYYYSICLSYIHYFVRLATSILLPLVPNCNMQPINLLTQKLFATATRYTYVRMYNERAKPVIKSEISFLSTQ